MTHVTCRLTAKNRDQLRNPTLGNRARATFNFFLQCSSSASLKTELNRLTRQVCVQPPTPADNVALLAFTACCGELLLGAGRAAVDRYLPPAGPTAANPPHAAAAGEWDRQTHGQTPFRYIGPAPHTRLVSRLSHKFRQAYENVGH